MKSSPCFFCLPAEKRTHTQTAVLLKSKMFVVVVCEGRENEKGTVSVPTQRYWQWYPVGMLYRVCATCSTYN